MFLLGNRNNSITSSKEKWLPSIASQVIKKQVGLTVVELMLALAILLLVLAGGYSFLFFGWSSFDRGTDRAVVQNNLRMAAEQITKEVRYASSIEIIDSSMVPDPVSNDDIFIFINNESRIEKKSATSSDIIPHELDSNLFLEVNFVRISGNLLKINVKESGTDMEIETEVRILNGTIDETVTSGNALKVGSNGNGGSNGSGDELAIINGNLPSAVVGVAYSHTFVATGGVEPYNFTITGGSLPAGLSLNLNGELIGTPTSEDVSNFTVTVTDNESTSDSYEFNLSVEASDTEMATITFDSAGGSSVDPITLHIGESVQSPADPTRSGYLFDGWNPDLPANMPEGGASLVAQWVTMPLALDNYFGNNASLTLELNQNVELTSYLISTPGKTITNFPPMPGESLTLEFDDYLSNDTYLCLTFNIGPTLYIRYRNPGHGWVDDSWNHSSCQ